MKTNKFVRLSFIAQLVLFLANFSIASASVFLSQDELDRSVTFASDPRFASVGAVRSFVADGWFSGSGVLIAPDWVLMSGHQRFTDPSDPRISHEFKLGTDRNNPVVTRTSTYAVAHPGWAGGNQGSVSGGVDLALFKLDAPIFDIPFAERFRGVDVLDSQNPTQYFMAGFGNNGIVGQNFNRFDGLKRAGTNYLESISGGTIFGPPESQINLIVRSYPSFFDPILDLEWAGAPGDSGGGWFQQVDGRFQLSAITSFGPLGNPINPYTGAVRVSMFNDWIDSTITAVPEPSSIILICVASLGFILYRNRSKSGKDARRQDC